MNETPHQLCIKGRAHLSHSWTNLMHRLCEERRPRSAESSPRLRCCQKTRESPSKTMFLVHLWYKFAQQQLILQWGGFQSFKVIINVFTSMEILTSCPGECKLQTWKVYEKRSYLIWVAAGSHRTGQKEHGNERREKLRKQELRPVMCLIGVPVRVLTFVCVLSYVSRVCLLSFMSGSLCCPLFVVILKFCPPVITLMCVLSSAPPSCPFYSLCPL